VSIFEDKEICFWLAIIAIAGNQEKIREDMKLKRLTGLFSIKVRLEIKLINLERS
jgi:hypothetical protein